MDAARTAQLDAIVEKALKVSGIPGAIVGVWGPEGKYVRAAGVANTKTRAPMESAFSSRIGSATKPFTVTAVLQLVDDGKVGLDDPISKYVDGVTDGKTVTIRQLAGMRSGVPDYSSTEAFVADYLADPKAPFTPKRLLGYVAGKPLKFKPGTQFDYSNTNTVLLGLLVEKVTGKDLRDVITSRILKPLGLTHTLFPRGNEMPDPHARGYTDQTLDGSVADATDYNPSWGWAAGAMISTLDDLHRWVPALVKGELLSKATQRERLKMEKIDTGTGYGLGVFSINGWIGHNGSLPGYKTVTVYLPEKDTTLVVLVNTDIEGKADLVGSLMTPLTKVISPGHVYVG
jgi:D-alanyl-D-alanine carboxypeptidase